jgi:hypothetical protein
MKDFLKDQLAGQFQIISGEENGTQYDRIYRVVNSEIDQDVYIELRYRGNYFWQLVEAQRNNEYLLGEFSNLELSYCACFLASVSTISPEPLHDSEVKAQLRQVGNQMSEVQKILIQSVAAKYFSLNEPVIGAINLEGNDSNYGCFYLSVHGEKVSIVVDRKVPSIFVVIYNYASKLQKFEAIMSIWEQNMKISSIEKERLKRIYLRK